MVDTRFFFFPFSKTVPNRLDLAEKVDGGGGGLPRINSRCLNHLICPVRVEPPSLPGPRSAAGQNAISWITNCHPLLYDLFSWRKTRLRRSGPNIFYSHRTALVFFLFRLFGRGLLEDRICLLKIILF